MRLPYPLGLLLVFHQVGCGQGTFDGLVLRTGGGQPLVTAVQSLGPIAATNAPPLQFQFGFATDEVFAPSNIFDSFTITVQDEAKTTTLVLLTADASGIVWAPPSPGTLVINPNSIGRVLTAFPSVQPVLTSQMAFQVSVPLPTQFNGLTANLYLDLFDNLDAQASLGLFKLTVVPEPMVWAIGLCGAIAWLAKKLKEPLLKEQ